jgi:hypothetical protein
MSDNPFSIGKAIREIVQHGPLTGVERKVHFELQREAESVLSEYKWLSSANARDIGLNVPTELFVTQLTTAAQRGRSQQSSATPERGTGLGTLC